MCNGCIVLHRDGAIADCSEELDGRPRAGYDAPHLAGVLACRISARWFGCRHCDTSAVGGGQLRPQPRLLVGVAFQARDSNGHTTTATLCHEVSRSGISGSIGR